MGFSIFSIIEIVYYITVRPYCAARTMEMDKKRKEAELKVTFQKKEKKIVEFN